GRVDDGVHAGTHSRRQERLQGLADSAAGTVATVTEERSPTVHGSPGDDMRADVEGDRSMQPLRVEGHTPAGAARRGPRTAAGKARVRLNAVSHGLGVTSPVIPGIENPEDWEAHRAAMLANLAPMGYLETVLAERVADAAWRLRRITRYEVACVVA